MVLLPNLGLVTALAVMGLDAHSLAVFAAGADYLADAAAVGVSLLAIRIASHPRGHLLDKLLVAIDGGGRDRVSNHRPFG